MIYFIILLNFLSSTIVSAGEENISQSVHICSKPGRAAAEKLFKMHYDMTENNISYLIGDNVKVLTPIKAPLGNRKYDVLEYWVSVGKMGSFRIRMIYAVLNTDGKPDCVLMGQEILDYSKL